MKKPVVDYRQMRFRNRNDPEFAHVKLLLCWVVYFLLYFLTENLIPTDACHVIHCALDDIIPFCEWFLIPYVLWYGLVAGSLVRMPSGLWSSIDQPPKATKSSN